ncbi:MAG: hypothetical protein ACI8UD_000560 [Planctomycetota bacterium]|jgi:hypothetical protein
MAWMMRMRHLPERLLWSLSTCPRPGAALAIGTALISQSRKRESPCAKLIASGSSICVGMRDDRRSPIAESRLSNLPDGRVAYSLKMTWRDGTTHVGFEATGVDRAVALPWCRDHESIW